LSDYVISNPKITQELVTENNPMIKNRS